LIGWLLTQEDSMRFVFVLALLALPATAFAQMSERPGDASSGIKCDPFSGGTLCARMDSTGVHAARMPDPARRSSRMAAGG
jgi:hypothetical protein